MRRMRPDQGRLHTGPRRAAVGRKPQQRLLMASLLATFALMIAISQVLASNFGIENEAEACSTTVNSQCAANNYLHNVWVAPGFSSTLLASLDDSIAHDFDSLRDIVARRVTSESDNDVRAFDNDYGDTTWIAYTTCAVFSTRGGTGDKRWCRPQLLYFNNGPAWAFRYDTATERGYLACQELGHTLGLRHATPATHPNYYSEPGTCMRPGNWDAPNLYPHDGDLLNAQY